jgi:micrococcal nuclease
MNNSKTENIMLRLFWILFLFSGVAFGQVPEGIYTVSDIIDGDTIKVFYRDKHEPVRLIGIDCPEMGRGKVSAQPFAIAARSYTSSLVLEGKNRVRLQYSGAKKDRYGRTLAMVYIMTDTGEICLNKELILKGLAKAQLQYRYSNKIKAELLNAELEARRGQLGIFSP